VLKRLKTDIFFINYFLPLIIYLKLQQPNWFLTKQKYDDSTIFPAYMKFTKTVVKLLLEEFSIDFDEKKEKEVESMIDMEKKIANVFFFMNFFNLKIRY
jgi:hypothetical protein